MAEYRAQNSGIDFSGLLTIVFIVLKLCGVIQWSWWWVISPILINIGLVLIVLIVYLVFKLRKPRIVKREVKSRLQERIDQMQKNKES